MQRLHVQLRLVFADGKTFGPGKADLLALIQRLGSIAAAGREMRMSYKRAWGLVEEMNRSFSAPLVTTERGGAGRGGAHVTELGAAVLARFRALETRSGDPNDPDISFLMANLAEPDTDLPKSRRPVMFDET
jgi:molybdate transport system regulatory protein